MRYATIIGIKEDGSTQSLWSGIASEGKSKWIELLQGGQKGNIMEIRYFDTHRIKKMLKESPKSSTKKTATTEKTTTTKKK